MRANICSLGTGACASLWPRKHTTRRVTPYSSFNQTLSSLFILLIINGFPGSLQANDIMLSGLSQNPASPVAVGTPATYTLTTNNVDDGINPPSTIGISLRMSVDGTVVRADSGEIDAVGCVVDASFPSYFACNNLTEGGSQTPSFTWNNPTPGSHIVTFTAACQWIPVQTPTAYCTSFGTSISTASTIGAYPTAVASLSGPLITLNAGASDTLDVNFNGAGSSDSDGTITTYQWLEGGTGIATGSTPTVNLGAGSHTITLRVTDNHGLTDEDTVSYTILSDPTANAGPDQSVTDTDNNGAENVTLDGSGSSDAGGSIVSYEWFETGTLLDSVASPTLALPVGTHDITLRVTDNDGTINEDLVIITVVAGPNAPSANAGPDQQLTDTDSSGSETVQLDGTASMDPDGSIVSYQWFDQGVEIATGATPSVELSVGEHNLTLRVTDNSALFNEDQVIITVAAGPSAPVADAGPDQQVTDTDGNGSEDIQLDGTGSSDSDGSIVSYQWLASGTQIATGATASVSLPVGVHALTLRVTDNDGQTGEDQLNITIVASTTTGTPTADAGADQTLLDSDADGSASVTLDGSASTDSDGSLVSYQWYEGGVEIATGATATVVLGIGVHTLTLRVTDDAGLTQDDQVIVTIRAEENLLQAVAGNGLSGSSGDTLGPFTVQLVDSSGTPIADSPILWHVVPENAATLSENESTTDSEGQASTTMTIARTGVIKLVATHDTSVEFVINSIAETPGLTQNQQAVGASMDNLCPSLAEKQATGTLSAGEQDLLMTCDSLVTETGTATALSRLAPEEVAAQGTASLEAASTQLTNVNTRLVALRAGDTGFNFSGLTLNYAGIAFNRRLFDGLIPEDKESLGAGAGDTELQGRWGAFVNGNVNFGEKDDTSRETGFDFDTSGITLGLDYRFSDQFIAGGALGISRYNSDYNQSAGDLEMDGWSLAAYGTYFRDNNIYVDGLLQLGSNSYDTRRRVNADDAADQFGRGDTEGMEYAFNLSAGYEYRRDAMTLAPYGRFSYTRAEIDAYTEEASDPAVAGFGSMLHIDDQDLESMLVSLGANLSYSINTASAVFIPQLRFEWEHEFKDDSRFISARFVNDPTRSVFDIETDEADKNYFNLGVGLSAVFAQGKSGYFFYETRVGQDDVTLHMLNAGIRVEF
ncbi:MAG: autotransporter domain-containing protein [Candidatus Thiodiazotropha sp.]